MPSASSQSASACRSPVKLRNERTDSSSRSGGTATTWNVAPISIPAACAFIDENDLRFDLLLIFLDFSIVVSPSVKPRGGIAQKITFLNGITMTASPMPNPQPSPDHVFYRAQRHHETNGRSSRRV